MSKQKTLTQYREKAKTFKDWIPEKKLKETGRRTAREAGKFLGKKARGYKKDVLRTAFTIQPGEFQFRRKRRRRRR